MTHEEAMKLATRAGPIWASAADRHEGMCKAYLAAMRPEIEAEARRKALEEAAAIVLHHSLTVDEKPVSKFASDDQKDEIFIERRGERVACGIILVAIRAMIDVDNHASDCATHNEPAMEAAPCDCEVPPVDRTARELSGGKPETDDHREINHATGLQKGYVVLTENERRKGFVRPFRDAYRHLTCGGITTMARDIAETYARDPYFYAGTFCSTCRSHFPVGDDDGEFTWYEMDGREGPKVGT